jgi:hypothetical protein
MKALLILYVWERDNFNIFGLEEEFLVLLSHSKHSPGYLCYSYYILLKTEQAVEARHQEKCGREVFPVFYVM